ncbi:hypothetical protein [uncultured Methanomethylovorans sp.]|uniref:hypothetical protein n=1 Tax=uncultured Methanomethylovorans sp. TaxID=183759 RepID=UPI002AA5FEAE|nr:hypothetical protein [uncultured Methanomethylovorans sp.]
MILEDERILFKLTIDEDGNAKLGFPLPKVSFEMDEDKMIRFLVALQVNTEICNMMEDAVITIESLDHYLFFKKLNKAMKEVNV